jgi:hypothetical protein
VPQAVLIIQTIAPHLRGDDEKKNVIARSVATKQSKQKAIYIFAVCFGKRYIFANNK